MIRIGNKRNSNKDIYIGRPSPLDNTFVIGRDGDRVKIIVAGSRNFANYNAVHQCLNIITREFNKDDITIISGTAKGADQLGERYAAENNLNCNRFPAEWNKYGKSAGYKRNEVMAQHATHLAAFWDGKSRGTMHMINLARRAGLITFIFDFDGIIKLEYK